MQDQISLTPVWTAKAHEAAGESKLLAKKEWGSCKNVILEATCAPEDNPAHVLIQAELSGCHRLKHVMWGRGHSGGRGEELERKIQGLDLIKTYYVQEWISPTMKIM